MIEEKKKEVGHESVKKSLFHLCSFRYFAGTFSNQFKLFLAEAIFFSVFKNKYFSVSKTFSYKMKQSLLLNPEETYRCKKSCGGGSISRSMTGSKFWKKTSFSLKNFYFLSDKQLVVSAETIFIPSTPGSISVPQTTVIIENALML